MTRIFKLGKSWYIGYSLDRRRVRKVVGHSERIAQLPLVDIEVKIAKKRAGFLVTDKILSGYIPQFLYHIRVHTKMLQLISSFKDLIEKV